MEHCQTANTNDGEKYIYRWERRNGFQHQSSGNFLVSEERGKDLIKSGRNILSSQQKNAIPTPRAITATIRTLRAAPMTRKTIRNPVKSDQRRSTKGYAKNTERTSVCTYRCAQQQVAGKYGGASSESFPPVSSATACTVLSCDVKVRMLLA